MPRLSFDDAKLILQDIEFGQGRIADVARRNPWLIEESQTTLRERHGDTVSLYRAVSVGKGLRPEAVVSTSLSVGVCLYILLMAAGDVGDGEGGWVYNTRTLLHYRVPVGKVLVSLDAVMPHVERSVGLRLNHRIIGRTGRDTDEFGEPWTIRRVLECYEETDEQEVIADVSGLKPAVLAFRSDDSRDRALFDLANAAIRCVRGECDEAAVLEARRRLPNLRVGDAEVRAFIERVRVWQG